MRKEMMSASVSPSLQVHLRLVEHISQFASLELQVGFCLLKYRQLHLESVRSLTNEFSPLEILIHE